MSNLNFKASPPTALGTKVPQPAGNADVVWEFLKFRLNAMMEIDVARGSKDPEPYARNICY